MKVIEVKHVSKNLEEQGGFYHFECCFDVDVDDIVLAETRYGLALAKVTKVDVDYPATASVLSKVNLNDYHNGLEKEKRLEELKVKMEKRRKVIKEMEMYALLAAKDETMTELLDEYKRLM